MQDGDKLSAILLQVGETKGKVSGMAEDLASVKKTMDMVVRRDECSGKHRIMEEALSRSISDMKEELRRGIIDIKRTTSQNVAISPQMLTAANNTPSNPFDTADIEQALQERAEERAEKRRKLIAWYLGFAVAIIGLTGTMGAFIHKTVLTLDKIQTVVASQPQELKEQLQKNAPKVVYVKIPDVTATALQDATEESTARARKLKEEKPRRKAAAKAAPAR